MAYDPVAVLKQAKKRRREGLRLVKAGKTQQEIANLWGISKARVSEILATARREASTT